MQSGSLEAYATSSPRRWPEPKPDCVGRFSVAISSVPDHIVIASPQGVAIHG
jgi:hypothetical protein